MTSNPEPPMTGPMMNEALPEGDLPTRPPRQVAWTTEEREKAAGLQVGRFVEMADGSELARIPSNIPGCRVFRCFLPPYDDGGQPRGQIFVAVSEVELSQFAAGPGALIELNVNEQVEKGWSAN